MCEVLRGCFCILCSVLIGVLLQQNRPNDEQSTVDESKFAPLGMLEPLHTSNYTRDIIYIYYNYIFIYT